MSKRDLIIFGTSSQHPTRERNHGGYLIRWNGEGFLCDPGEGTQRQFIFANVSPTQVSRILISHFHGDHCLGVGSMLMRLNLDGVEEVHCYYPASGKKYFDRLRYGTIYHEAIRVIEHPVEREGLVHDDGNFSIEAYRLDHGNIENLGWRIKEADEIKFHKDKLKAAGVSGPRVSELKKLGALEVEGKKVSLEEVSYVRKGDAVAIVLDTRPCSGALKTAEGARLLLSESTYLESEKHLAKDHYHLTAKEAAEIACAAQAKQLILTHFSARYVSEKAFEDEAKKHFPHTVAAKDLDVFDFPK